MSKLLRVITVPELLVKARRSLSSGGPKASKSGICCEQGVNTEGLQLRLVDAREQVVGRLATQLALILQVGEEGNTQPATSVTCLCGVASSLSTVDCWSTGQRQGYLHPLEGRGRHCCGQERSACGVYGQEVGPEAVQMAHRVGSLFLDSHCWL